MVKGDTQAIDSAPVKANASMESLLLKQPKELVQQQETGKQRTLQKNNKLAQPIPAPDHQLRKLEKHQENLRGTFTSLGSTHEKSQLLSNKTHYSPHDPDGEASGVHGCAR